MRHAALSALILIASIAVARADDRASDVSIPMVAGDGEHLNLAGRVCRPAGDGPSRVVVINHGSPVSASARPRMELTECDAEATQWFTRRGYVVVYALRRGYGDSDGDWAEGYGHCSDPDFVRAGLSSARDIAAIVRYALALPYARHDGAVVIGQSAGGWGTIAYASQTPKDVAAFVVMAGGRGGHADGEANENCQPGRLVQAAGRFGATARLPMLWIYALNDSFFDPSLASAMHDAFTRAGGNAQFIQPPPFGDDGHHLFFGDGGPAVWGAPVAAYLARMGATP